MSKARAANVVVLLLLLAAARAADGRQQGDAAPRRLALPDKDWALDITLPPRAEAQPASAPAAKPPDDTPVAVGEPIESLTDDGRGYRLLLFLDYGRRRRPHDARMLTVTLDPAKAPGGAEAFRDYVLKRATSRVLTDGVKTSEHGGIPVARYRIALESHLQLPPAPPTTRLYGAQRVAQAFLTRDDVWVGLTLSGQEFDERDERLFHSLLDSLKFTDTSAPSTSFDFYHKGRLLYMRRDYRRASGLLAAAVELEKRERRLDRASWRNLVINLVDSYAAARDLARAKEALDYGVALDPTNPVFHMALARYHAMQDDLDNTIASLERAHLNRESRFQAALLIDPLRDPAFERFRDNQKFRKAVKAIKK